MGPNVKCVLMGISKRCYNTKNVSVCLTLESSHECLLNVSFLYNSQKNRRAHARSVYTICHMCGSGSPAMGSLSPHLEQACCRVVVGLVQGAAPAGTQCWLVMRLRSSQGTGECRVVLQLLLRCVCLRGIGRSRVVRGTGLLMFG